MTESTFPDAEDLRRAMTARAEMYSLQTGLSLSEVGRRVKNEKSFFFEIGKGRNFTVDTYKEVMDWFDKNGGVTEAPVSA